MKRKDLNSEYKNFKQIRRINLTDLTIYNENLEFYESTDFLKEGCQSKEN